MPLVGVKIITETTKSSSNYKRHQRHSSKPKQIIYLRLFDSASRHSYLLQLSPNTDDVAWIRFKIAVYYECVSVAFDGTFTFIT